MHATTQPTEVLLRINLNAGLTESETIQLSSMAEKLGGLDKAVLAALRRGLDAAKTTRKGAAE